MTTHNIHISQGRVIDPANNLDQVTDIYIVDGKIAGIGDKPQGFQATQVINAQDQIVCPGLIDMAVNLREPGQEHKATIQSETAAAASAGITTLVCTPDTYPVVDTPAVWELIRRRAKACGQARVLSIGALTHDLAGKQLAEMAALKEVGCVAMSNASYPMANTMVAHRAMQYAATFELPVFLHAEDHHLKGSGCVHEGPTADRMGLVGIPSAAETVAVARDLALAEHADARIHFHSLSTAAATEMIAAALDKHMQVSADVAIHQLFLLDTDVDGYNASCHVSPPLRTSFDRDQLRAAVANGVIQAICSDHQPHEADAKMAPFPETATGISGLETLLPLVLKLVDEKVFDLTTAIASITANPAAILDLPYGTLSPGAEADICIFDPQTIWTLDPEKMHSAGKNTPFADWEFKGKVTHTIYEGRLIYSEQTA